MASAFDMMRSIDWDIDLHLRLKRSVPRKALLCMLIIAQQDLDFDGIAPGGKNFDCNRRRESTDLEDMFIAHIGSMDCLARGLRYVSGLVEQGLLQKVIDARYRSWEQNPLAKKVKAGKGTFDEIEAYAKTKESAMKFRSALPRQSSS